MKFWNTIREKVTGIAPLIVLLFCYSFTSAQTNSSYSALGLGDLTKQGFVNHTGNGMGLSKGEYWFVNQMNPALLIYNQVTTFQVGMGYESKTVSQNDLQDKYSSLNLLYFGSAVPAKVGKWSFAVGVQPYSRILYNFTRTSDIAGSGGNTVTITNEGSGGFNQAYFSHGVKIWRDLSIGVRASYVFSSLIKESTTIIGDVQDPSRSARATYQRTNASDVIFSTGLSYKQALTKDVTANFGVTFEPESKLSVKRFERIDVRTTNGTVIDVDTLSDGLSGHYRLPQKWGFGFSVNKGFNWALGIEGEYSQWSRYRDFSNQNTNLGDGFAVRMGGDIIPNPFAVENYLNRMIYRLGVSYERLPFTLSGENIGEYGASFGFSLPVSRISYIDLSFRYASRGSTKNNLIRENYFQIQLGFTFNDRWFIRSAYD